jgi:hypothetical protein
MMKKAIDFDAKMVEQEVEESMQALATAFPKGKTISTSSQRKEGGPLPIDFTPTSYCVMCGKGRDCFNAIGNRRFRVVIEMNLERYSLATRKSAKSEVVSAVVEMIHSAGGRFIKNEHGRWIEISDAAAREKVGALFRDCLHSQYKSSGKAKTARRRDKQHMQISQPTSPSLDQQMLHDTEVPMQVQPGETQGQFLSVYPDVARVTGSSAELLNDYCCGIGDDEFVKDDLPIAEDAILDPVSNEKHSSSAISRPWWAM